MKNLHIMRHAKASWGNAECEDYNRPLAQDGLKQTAKIIQFLLDQKVSFDMVFSSPAVRAIETARLVAGASGIASENIVEYKSIYNQDADHLINLFFEIPEWVNHLLLVGHNPGVTELVNYFGKQAIDMLPTSGVAALEFDIDTWTEILGSKSKLKYCLFPAMLM